MRQNHPGFASYRYPVGMLSIQAGPIRVMGTSHARDAASASDVDRQTRMAALVPTVNRLKYSPDPSL
jgi:hypothetical protein